MRLGSLLVEVPEIRKRVLNQPKKYNALMVSDAINMAPTPETPAQKALLTRAKNTLKIQVKSAQPLLGEVSQSAGTSKPEYSDEPLDLLGMVV